MHVEVVVPEYLNNDLMYHRWYVCYLLHTSTCELTIATLDHYSH